MMSSERKFASLQLVVGADNIRRFIAVADDGSGWVSDVEWIVKPEGGQLKRVQAQSWHQIKALPSNDD